MLRKCLAPIAVRLGLYKQIVKIDTHFKNKKAARCFRRYGLETLQKADEALSGVGCHMVLYFGTLLGAIREKGFIPYDYDLDVALPIEERPDNIVSLMKQYGFEHDCQQYIKSTGRIVFDRFCYHGTNLDIDYIFSDRTDGKMYTYAVRRHETKEWREANETDGFPCDIWPLVKSGFIRTNFLGLNLYIPEMSHQWMRDIYGETYMTPIRSWDSKNQKTAMEHSTERAYRRYNEHRDIPQS